MAVHTKLWQYALSCGSTKVVAVHTKLWQYTKLWHKLWQLWQYTKLWQYKLWH